MTRRFLAILVLVLQFGLNGDAAELSFPGLIKREFIYETAPFPECHASTLVETKQQVLLAAWFGGTKEKHPDVGIWVARYGQSARSKPVQVATGKQPDGKQFPCWNPVLFQPTGGELQLYYKVGPDPRSWWGMLLTSNDDGETWSEPRRLPDGYVGPIKNKPVEVAPGKILCPTSTEDQGWRLHFEWTDALAKDWQRTDPLNDSKQVSLIQPTILVHPNNTLQALCRSKNKRIYELWSTDLGQTWSKPSATELPNPNSGIDAVTLRNGTQALIYNHVDPSTLPSGANLRSPLNLAISKDGKSWEAAGVLESEKGEFSYPAVIESKSGMLHVSYTWQRKKVAHLVIDPQLLRGQPIVQGAWPQ